MFLCRSSSDAPLETKMHYRASDNIPMIGFVLKDFLEMNDGMYFDAIRVTISVHEQ